MERDINDIFDEVSMGEEKFYKEGYSDGFKKGYQQAFDLDPSGYSCGVEASYEIAMYHAFLTVRFKDKLSRNCLKLLKDFKEELDNFNTTSPKLISDKLKSLKISYNKLCGALMLPNERNGNASADMSF